MKPIKLSIEGLNSFVEKQELNFADLHGHKIFGIFGQTGSGKSTILDAICLALYGNIERSKSNIDFINLKTRCARVEFSFEYIENGKSKVYKVFREFKLSKSDDVTQKAIVYEISKGAENVVMEGPTKVDMYLRELIGLTQNEFSKCVALPQGEFAGFLKAKPNERINIIGGIFDLNKYGEKLWEKARARANNTQTELATIKSKIEMCGDISETKRDNLLAEYNQLQKNIEENRELIAKSTETITREKDLAKAQKELDEVEATLVELSKNGMDVSDKKARVGKAKAIKANATSIDTIKSLNIRIAEEEKGADKVSLELANKNESAKKSMAENELKIESLKTENMSLEEKKDALSVASVVFDELNKLKDSRASLVKNITELELAKTDAIQEKQDSEQKLELLNSKYDEQKKIIEEVEQELVSYYDVTSYEFYVKERDALDSYIKYVELLVKGAVNLKANANNKLNETIKEINDQTQKLKKLRKDALGTTKLDVNSKMPIIVDAINNLVMLLSKLNITEEYVKNLDDRLEEYNKENLLRKKKIEIANDSLAKEKANKVSLEGKISALKEAIVALEKQRVDAICNNSVVEFTDKYKIGDACPICNNEIITKNVMGKLNVIVIEQEIKNKSNELDNLYKQLDLSKEAIAKVSQEIDDQNEEIGYNNDSITALELEINSKCSKLLNKKNAKPSDISIVQLQVKDDIVKLEEKRKEEIEIIERISTLEADKTKYNSILVASANKLNDYTELKNSISEFKLKIDAEINFVTGGGKIDDRIKEHKALTSRRKDAELKANQLHEQIVEVGDLLKKLAETHSAITAETSLKSAQLQAVNADIEQKEDAVAQYNSIKSFAKAINEIEIKIAVNLKEINLCTINSDKIKEEVSVIQSNLNNINSLLKEHTTIRNNTLDNLMKNLNSVGIEHFDDIDNARMTDEEISKIDNFISTYDGDVALLCKRKDALKKELGSNVVDAGLIDSIQQTIVNTTKIMNERIEESGRKKSEIETMTEKLKTLSELKLIELDLTNRYNIESELCDTLRGKALVEFVAEEFMDDITYMASEKLQELMDGRYVLKYKDKDFMVVDNFNNGEERSSRTLSGGELFVVSLALALSISDALMSRSNKRLDFFFLDEGFGTLDKEYCEYIVSLLQKLANRNMTIGLISHIPELQERITKKFMVTKPSQEKGSKVQFVEEV